MNLKELLSAVFQQDELSPDLVAKYRAYCQQRRIAKDIKRKREKYLRTERKRLRKHQHPRRMAQKRRRDKRRKRGW